MLRLFIVLFTFFAMPILAFDGEVKKEDNQPYPPSVQELEQIDTFSPSMSDPYLINLAMNYKSFATYEACLMGDYSSGERFAQKAIAAHTGERVLPENPSYWSVAPEHQVAVNRGYENLIYILEHNAADSFPALTAEAQAKFDCWIEQATENTQPDHIDECRLRFESAMMSLNEKFDFKFIQKHESQHATSCSKKKKKCIRRVYKKKEEPQEEVVQNEESGVQILTPVQGCCGDNPVTREEFDALKEEVALLRQLLEDLHIQFQSINVEHTSDPVQLTMHNETFEIFFDFDSSEIKPEYHDLLARVAKIAEKSSGMNLLIFGHTDTKGYKAYNKNLGLRRANAIKAFLIKYGANRDSLSVTSYGEHHLRLKTPDATKEPQNRRAVIEAVPAK